jgi:methionyl-tRNA formyltransferase
MTTTDSQVFGKRYALMLNGANFACEVLQSLQQDGFPPAFLVLPEYAPADSKVVRAFELEPLGPRRRLQDLAGSIPIVYAPQLEQANCAQTLRQQAIEFLLVACWPYLIGPEMIASASKASPNLHPSMLPQHRGPDPIGQQLASGNQGFGVTLHLLNARFDQGDIVAQSILIDIGSTKNRDRLEKRAAQQGSKLFIDAISEYDNGWHTQPQTQVM